MKARSAVCCAAFAMALAASMVAAQAPTADLTNPTLAFENMTSWTGLTPDTEIKHEGATAGAWLDTVAVTRVQYRIRQPLDLTGYEAASVWVHSARPTGAFVSLVLVSRDKEAGKDGTYLHRIAVDWEGWKQIVVPLSQFRVVREPAGFNRIDMILLASQGYTSGEPKPDTQLRFDDLRFLAPGGASATPATGAAPATTSTSTTAAPAAAAAASPSDWKPFDGALLSQRLEAGRPVLIYFRAKDNPISESFERAYLLTPQALASLGNHTLFFVETTTMPLVAQQYKVVRVPAIVLVEPGDKRTMLSVTEATSPTEISEFLAMAAKAGRPAP